MRTKTELWQILERLVAEQGLSLYDLEIPSRPAQGVLRIFVACRRDAPETAAGTKSGGVGIEDCARVSRRVSEWIETEMPDFSELALEVSSPGINRKLSRPEHYASAVGERVKLKLRPEAGKRLATAVVRGTLRSFESDTIELEDERSKRVERLALSDIQQGHVDFLF